MEKPVIIIVVIGKTKKEKPIREPSFLVDNQPSLSPKLRYYKKDTKLNKIDYILIIAIVSFVFVLLMAIKKLFS